MTRSGGPGDGTPSLESLRQLRLRALLNDLVQDLGPVKAAERLGIDRKTLWRNERAGEMSPRLVEALERLLLERAAADGRRVAALEERVDDLERKLAQLLEAKDSVGDGGARVNAAIDALQRQFTHEIQRLGRRLAQQGELESPAPPLSHAGSRTGRDGTGRRYPDVVTWRPADGDETAFGAAWPLVEECAGGGPGILPQVAGWLGCRRARGSWNWKWRCWRPWPDPTSETEPLRGLDRNDQLSWRLRELAGVRRRRARLELLSRALRLLTMGRWR